MENQNLTHIYLRWYQRLFLAILVGTGMVLFAQRLPVSEIITLTTFYISSAGSSLIALLIIESFHRTAVWLDKRLGLTSLAKHEPVLRVVVLLLGSLALSVALAWIYFRSFGFSIHDTGYWTYEFPFIATLLGLLYLKYSYRRERAVRLMLESGRGLQAQLSDIGGVHDGQVSASRPQRLQQEVGGQQVSAEPPVHHTPKPVRYPKKFRLVDEGNGNNEIETKAMAVVYRRGKSGMVYMLDGKKWTLLRTLQSAMELLDPHDFFLVNRNFIIQRKAVKGYHKIEKQRLEVDLILELDTPFLPTIPKEKRKAFLDWYENQGDQAPPSG